MSIIVPEYVPYLLAILALLIVWQLYSMQVLAGRVETKNFWERTGVRVFLHVTPEDDQACAACREANGVAVDPAIAVKSNFSSVLGTCTNPNGCRCMLIGLHGGWPEAQRLLSSLMRSSSKTVKLSTDKLTALLNVPWDQAPNAKSDRVSISMLEGIRAETEDPAKAVKKYQRVIDDAKTARDLPLVIPAYLRMLDLLERTERTTEALGLIDRFEKEFGETHGQSNGLSSAQRESLSLRKLRLTAAAQQPY